MFANADNIISDELLEEMVAFAFAAIREPRANFRESWVLVPRDFHGIGTEDCSVVIKTGSLAPSDKLLWIDYSLFDIESDRRTVARQLLGEFLPLLESSLGIRVIGHQCLDRLEISLAEPRNDERHESTPLFSVDQNTLPRF